MASILSELRPTIATLACLGNHDYGLWHPLGWQSRGLAEFLADQLGSVGVHTLINESRTFTRGLGRLRFAGTGDYWSSAYKPKLAMADDSSLDRQPTPTIALCHNPDAALELAALGANTVLSGHTHGKSGPHSRVRRALFPQTHLRFVGGYYRLPGRKHLYVNRGIGNSRRTSASTQPEITVITLRSGSCMDHWTHPSKKFDVRKAPALLDV